MGPLSMPVKKNRPLIRWAGSKTRLLQVLEENSPKSFGRYIEPFCGSMSLFLQLNPASAVMGDINEELINFYNQVKIYPLEVARGMSGIPSTKDAYYEVRSLDASKLSDMDRAVRFFFLNRHCFNGVYRTNKKGQFNVPYGSKLTEIPGLEEIVEFSSKIKRTTFLNSDFESTVEHATSGDFLYLDPPYAGTASRDRGEYGMDSFKEIDIDRLSCCLNKASERGVHVLLSYACIPVIKEKFLGWHIQEITVGRSVSGFAKGRKNVQEVLIKNY